MSESTNPQIEGHITQIIGGVIDVTFPDGQLPKILDALHVTDAIC